MLLTSLVIKPLFQISLLYLLTPPPYSNIYCNDYIITPNQLIGTGGGGSVYEANLYKNDDKINSNKQKNSNDNDNEIEKVIVKISNQNSGNTLINECNILNHLKKANVEGVEK